MGTREPADQKAASGGDAARIHSVVRVPKHAVKKPEAPPYAYTLRTDAAKLGGLSPRTKARLVSAARKAS